MILAMRQIQQIVADLKITKDEWFTAWMLGRVRKRKKIDSHELQSLRNVVKRGGDTIIQDFENTFQELVVEGKRKKASVVNNTKLSSRKKEEFKNSVYGNFE